ncbi:MAG: hypothetical protein R2698_01085 [Microthrixaceae bacterium]
MAPRLAAAGGEVVLVGNASRLDHVNTTVRFTGDSYRVIADRIGKALGVDAVETAALGDSADIEVVLGSDHHQS